MNDGLHERVKRHFEELCKDPRGRYAGSPGERAAVEYLSSEFEALGYDVFHEEYESPGWTLNDYSLSSENGTDYDAYPCFFSRGGEVEGPLRLLSLDHEADKPASDFAGGICLAYGNFVTVLDTNALAERFDEAGVKALIIASPYQDTYSTKLIRTPDLKRLVVMTVSKNTALELARQQAAGTRFRVKVDADVFRYRAVNVIARLPGRPRIEGEYGAVGAHFDTAPGIQGAADNATGTVAILELARMLRPALEKSERTIEWVGCNIEEVADLGHRTYVKMRREAGEKPAWMVDIDDIGTYLGVMVPRVSRSRSLFDIVSATMEPRGVKPLYLPRFSHSFYQSDVPLVHFYEPGNPNGDKNFPLHSPRDTMDLVNTELVAEHIRGISETLERMLEWRERPVKTWEVAPLADEHLPEVDAIMKDIWTMGIDLERERRYGRIGDRPWHEWLRESMRDLLAKPGIEAFVTLSEGRVVGFFTGWCDDATGIGEVGGNGVHPEYGGRGIGRFQLEYMLDVFRRRGVRFAEVTTGLNAGHAAARALYEGAGFAPLTESVRYTLPL